MWIKNIFFAIIGLFSGTAAAGGTFSLLVKIGIFTRIAQLLREGNRIRVFECGLILGGVVGNLFSLFMIPLHGGWPVLALYGAFCGMFVGWLAMALAETLNVFPIMFRRIKLKYGAGLVVLCLGIGKMLGSLLFFFKHWTA